jgi:hypothetical protein
MRRYPNSKSRYRPSFDSLYDVSTGSSRQNSLQGTTSIPEPYPADFPAPSATMSPSDQQPTTEDVPVSPPTSLELACDGPETVNADNRALFGEDPDEQQCILASFQRTSSARNTDQLKAPVKSQASSSRVVRFPNSLLGHSILGAPEIRLQVPTVATTPAQPPRGPSRPPTIVNSAPLPSPRQPSHNIYPTLNPWDRQYPNKAGTLTECSFRPCSPCIEDHQQTPQRLQLGSKKLTTTASGQEMLQEIRGYFASLGPAPEYLGPPEGIMEGVVPDMHSRAPKHTRSDTFSAGPSCKRQKTPSGRAATTAPDISNDEETARSLDDEQDWAAFAAAHYETVARKLQEDEDRLS